MEKQRKKQLGKMYVQVVKYRLDVRIPRKMWDLRSILIKEEEHVTEKRVQVLVLYRLAGSLWG
jgi:hypothetical protein